MNTKLHAVTDANGRPLSFFVTADRGYDADWFRGALEQKRIKQCILGHKSRSLHVKSLSHTRNQIFACDPFESDVRSALAESEVNFRFGSLARPGICCLDGIRNHRSD